MEFAINRFHEIVNQGPLYVCTCCDQLWYRHSVRCTNKLRQSKPDIVKYLLNKTSVGNKEWVCQTCSRYLMKNKVPPCSIANGMGFPVKPDFFDLNELECRLLAPRIGRYKSRTGSTRTASPGRINSDRLGSSRIMKKNHKVKETETFTHLKAKIPVNNGPN